MEDVLGDWVPKVRDMVVALAAFGLVIALLLLFVERGPKSVREKVQVAIFAGPALFLLAIGLVYPAVRTTFRSLFGQENNFIGLENYQWIFDDPVARRSVINTVFWVVLTPLLATAIGLAYAIIIDRTKFESLAKSLVFMPMAISFVGAGIIWRFVYAFRGQRGSEQIGLANQFLVWFGQEPRRFLNEAPWNTLFLIIVMVWIQTGFATVVLSASIKNIPAEITEAATLDGATRWQLFRNVTVPGIRPALVVVLTTISIGVLKVFDIVRTMTGGQTDSSVVALEMYNQSFRYGEQGRGAAMAVLIFLLVVPLVVYNIRQMARNREIR
jgi:alpha-glucoside transport system permease protein